MVQSWRQSLGIKPMPRGPDLSGYEIELGQRTDADIARDAGVRPSAVSRLRNAKGIQPAPRPRKHPPAWLTNHVIKQLGRIPDTHLARKIGVNRWAVVTQRRRLGIASSVNGRPRKGKHSSV